ncbi:MAG: hypothetical protein VX495_02070, partial [Nitrospinota bacterium]|nr:hypothetical protein [Nitrospinota bacterium]
SNTPENSDPFLARYPHSPKNSEEARRQIEKMKLQKFPISELPTRESNSPTSSSSIVSEPITIESMETPKSSMSDPIIREKTIEIVAEPKLGGRSKIMQPVDEFPEGEPALDPEPMPLDETPVKEKIE